MLYPSDTDCDLSTHNWWMKSGVDKSLMMCLWIVIDKNEDMKEMCANAAKYSRLTNVWNYNATQKSQLAT